MLKIYESSTSGLAKLIHSCKYLGSICLHCDLEEQESNSEFGSELEDSPASRASYPQSHRLLRRLARFNGLEELDLRQVFEYKTSSAVLRRLKHPFKNLRNLAMNTEARSVSLLASKFNPNSLTALDS